MFTRFSVYAMPIVAVLSLLSVSDTANAVPLKLFVATEYGIDQNTGLKGPKPLNPSGEAELTFFERGIELRFEDAKQSKHAVRIHLDFDGLLEVPMEARKMATEIYDNVQLNGPRTMANILQQISAAATTHGHKLIVMLDSYKNPGFLKVDFDLGSVRLMSTTGENVRFQNLVAQNFFPAVPENAAKAQAVAAESPQEKALEMPPKSVRVGDEGTRSAAAETNAEARAALVTCELRFTPTW